MTLKDLNGDNYHRALGWLNTALLAVVIFFLTRMVTQFDRITENVTEIRVEIAKMQSEIKANSQLGLQNAKELDDVREKIKR